MPDGVLFGDIGLDGVGLAAGAFDRCLDGLCRVVPSTIGERNARPLAGKRLRDRRADPPAAAGDERDTSLQSQACRGVASSAGGASPI